jgi:hypothetical protein
MLDALCIIAAAAGSHHVPAFELMQGASGAEGLHGGRHVSPHQQPMHLQPQLFVARLQAG